MKIAIALSGGVDSSTAAYLLKQQGHDIFALFMKNWVEADTDGRCTSESDYEDMVRVCETLDIPYYGLNFTKEYWDQVFSHFLNEMKQGYTPNPDILCNREIKFKVLYEKALALGADLLATGHYCQTDGISLLKGSDPNKDQSYFLYTIKRPILEKVLFPIGNTPKPKVRQIAKEANLPVFNKKDSTGICFIGERRFGAFLSQYLPQNEGPIETLSGTILGTHPGIHHFTLGQRKGLRIGGEGEAYFVVGKEIDRNAVIVAQGKNHPALFSCSLTATEISWVDSSPKTPFRCAAKIRYRQKEEPCLVESLGEDQLRVTFDHPQRAITPRQSVVFYEKNRCLGGAMIEKAGASLFSA